MFLCSWIVLTVPTSIVRHEDATKYYYRSRENKNWEKIDSSIPHVAGALLLVQSARVNKYKIANTLSLTNTPYRFTRDSDRWVPCSDWWVEIRD